MAETRIPRGFSASSRAVYSGGASSSEQTSATTCLHCSRNGYRVATC